jgi:hypothetical protein
MMKKQLKWMLVLCCGLVMSAGFAACDDDDDDHFQREETDEEKSYFDRELATADVTYKVRLAKDELKLYDVKISYMDEKGVEQSFLMNDTAWTLKRSLTPKDLPAEFVLRAKPSLKDGLVLDDNAQFQVGCITKLLVVVKNSYGRVICERDDIGLSPSDFVTMTGADIKNPWSSAVSDLFGSLFNTDKKSVTVSSNKIKYNGMSEHYW